MAAFPSALVPSQASTIRPDRGLKTYTTEGGGVRGRVQYAEALYYLTLVYEDLDDTDHDLIISHFENSGDPAGDHTVIVRSDTYDVNYIGQPEVVEHRGVLRTVEVSFIGTKQ